MRRAPVYALGAVLLIALAITVASIWARTPDRDVRCDKAKRAELREQGERYSCLIEIPGHDRGH